MLYFSGVDRSQYLDILRKERAAGMINRFVLTERLLQACLDTDIPLVMDSGAYLKELTPVHIEEYAKIILRCGDRFDWYASPDRIGDQEQSNRNYAFLLSLLPTRFHAKVLWIYQYGSERWYLHDALTCHRRIGIGGLVPVMKRRVWTMTNLGEIAAYVAHAGVEPHYFGLSTFHHLQLLATYYPKFTADSTTWLIAASHGEQLTQYGQRLSLTKRGAPFQIDEYLTQNVRNMNTWTVPLSKALPRVYQMSLDCFPL